MTAARPWSQTCPRTTSTDLWEQGVDLTETEMLQTGFIYSIAQPVKRTQEVELFYRKPIPAFLWVIMSEIAHYAHYQVNETRTDACWNQHGAGCLESVELSSWFLKDVVNGIQDFYCVMLQMCAALTWGSVWSERDTGGRRPSEGPSALVASPGPCPHPDQWAPSLFSVQNNSTSKRQMRKKKLYTS